MGGTVLPEPKKEILNNQAAVCTAVDFTHLHVDFKNATVLFHGVVLFLGRNTVGYAKFEHGPNFDRRPVARSRYQVMCLSEIFRAACEC